MLLEIFEGICFTLLFRTPDNIKVKKYYLIEYFLDLEMIHRTQLQ